MNFVYYLLRLQVRARTARRKLQDHSKETTAEEIAMQRNELHELITQCEQTYKDRVVRISFQLLSVLALTRLHKDKIRKPPT